jgi:hypothetical protein
LYIYVFTVVDPGAFADISSTLQYAAVKNGQHNQTRTRHKAISPLTECRWQAIGLCLVGTTLSG